MLDEERVDRDPVLRVDRARERPLGLLGGPGPDDAEPVRDPVDVRVDRDRGDPVPEHEHAVRRLGPDPVEGGQLLERPGHHPAEPLEKVPGDLAEDAGLRVVKARAPDERLDLGDRGAGQGRGVRESGEQERARHVGRLVARPLGEDRADEHLERVLRVVPKVGGPPVTGTVEHRETVEQRLPVESGVAHGRVRWRGTRPGRVGPRSGSGSVSGREPVTPGSERSGSSVDPLGRRSSPTR